MAHYTFSDVYSMAYVNKLEEDDQKTNIFTLKPNPNAG